MIVYKDGRTEERVFVNVRAFYNFFDKNRKAIRYAESENLHPTKSERGIK